MKKLFLLIVLGVLSLTANAQTRFGYFSFDNVLKSMPDYVMAQRSIDDLRQKYDAEMKRAEDEFNSKYEEFLDVQKDLVPAILRKRQAELQEMMQKNINFKNESQRLLKQAEADAFAPVKNKLYNALTKVGQAQGYAFILNTDGDACPYVNPEMGEDATELIKEALN
ncbi:MAG: OmpH family outer membrane protein [Prevotella stercorea]|uniref:OmpH family outer membrane protein n=1 Tax=Leyella stercorea TaxID=363265 RepID=UPI0003357F5D|nr:OmpH family outer membrane protein [Leyella stercorea]MCI5988372.1 OmpH family outer membrane protein [Prevotella sp.]CDB05820.1 outer membrane protein [Prevotella sp. CAG:520]MCF2614288.1 OmpH family outer membrane protein [Leyella stercorea]MCI6106284.1 OmpH family outer membrane protein [Prevotella sp.]MCI6131757.1 OmpH family outer membrane protein [Prevotella sp.]